THGRQIRLERELHGHWDVEFGKPNAPFVESLWKRDRLRFWLNIARFSPFFVFGLSAWAASDLRLPGVEGDQRFGEFAAVILVSVVLWTPIVAFLWNATSSQRRLNEALQEPHPHEHTLTRSQAMEHERPRWLRDAGRGTWAWTMLSAAGVGAIIGMVAAGI
ncbi:MAG TPA: hypothetical protein VI818_02160, partial [Candidatus Thermoplasmatota archaeon]|nr:hypothetical protein [Candidatus Thermoplasmatota archaeon]